MNLCREPDGLVDLKCVVGCSELLLTKQICLLHPVIHSLCGTGKNNTGIIMYI